MAAVLLTAALLVWILSVVDRNAVGKLLSEVELRTLLAVMGALLASYLLRALRLFEELRTEFEVRVRDCLRIVLLHNMSVNVVPFRAGEAALPLLLAREIRIPLRRGLVTLAWLRIQDASIVVAITLLAWPDIKWPLRVVGIVALLVILASLLRWARRVREPVVGLECWREALRRATARSWRTWPLCAANWGLKLAAIAWLLHELTRLPQRAAAIGALGGEAASFLPVQGVAGFGTYEAGVAFGAAIAMPGTATSLASVLPAALAAHLLVIASAVVAGSMALLLPRPMAATIAVASAR